MIPNTPGLFISGSELQLLEIWAFGRNRSETLKFGGLYLMNQKDLKPKILAKSCWL